MDLFNGIWQEIKNGISSGKSFDNVISEHNFILVDNGNKSKNNAGYHDGGRVWELKLENSCKLVLLWAWWNNDKTSKFKPNGNDVSLTMIGKDNNVIKRESTSYISD